MFVNIVSVVFKLLNCALLFSLVYIVFKSYFVSSIKEKVQEKINSLKELNNNQLTIEQEQDRIEQEIYDQEQEGKRLLALLQLWQGSVQRVQEKDEQQKSIQEIKNSDRALVQEHYKQIRKLELDIIPEIVQRTRTRLTEEFQDEQQGTQFLNALIERLQKSHI